MSLGTIKVLHILGGGIKCGVGTHVFTLMKGFSKTHIGMKLAVLKNGPLYKEGKRAGFDVQCLNKKFGGDLRVIPQIASIVNQERIEIVHTHTENSNFYGRLAAKLAARKPKVVTTVHTFKDVLKDIYESDFLINLIHRQNVWMSRFSDRLIGVTEGVKERLVEAGVAEDKVAVIPNAIDLPNYNGIADYNTKEIKKGLNLPLDEPIIGVAGRLAPVKNYQLFLRAAQQIIRGGIKANFLVIGEGPLEKSLKELAFSLGISEHVLFLGWVDDLPPILSILDVFVSTSITETTSLVVLEAMALGKPVVATNAGSLNEIIKNGETGILIALGDLSALTNSIMSLLNDQEGSKKMGVSARRVINQRHQLSSMIKKTEELYLRLLD